MHIELTLALQRIFVSFLMGFIIGLERERRGAKRFMIAGVRTFPLVSVSGTMVYLIAHELENYYIIIVGMLFPLILSVLVAYIHYSMGVPGLTTSTIVFVAFLIGIITGMGHIEIGAILTVITVILGLERSLFKSIAENVSQAELIEAIEFIVIALIVYPLVPTEKIYGIVDLRWYVYIIIVISVLSFISFVAMRIVGIRWGSIISALLGGLVNSEATTVSLVNRLKAISGAKNTLLAGVLLTNVTMLLRNVIIAILSIRTINYFVGTYFLLLFPSIIVSIVISYYYVKKAMKEKITGIKIEIESPLGLKNSIKFSLIFLLIYLISALILERYSNLIYVLAIGGFVSAAAVVSTISLMSLEGIVSLKTAAIVASLATVISYLDKVFYANPAGVDTVKSLVKILTLGSLPTIIVIFLFLLFG